MAFRERDFLKRIVERLSQAVAAIAGRRHKVDPEVLVDDLRREREDSLGVPLAVLDVLAPKSVRELLGSDDAVRAYAELLRLEAELLEESGRPAEAASLRARIESLSD